MVFGWYYVDNYSARILLVFGWCSVNLVLCLYLVGTLLHYVGIRLVACWYFIGIQEVNKYKKCISYNKYEQLTSVITCQVEYKIEGIAIPSGVPPTHFEQTWGFGLTRLCLTTEVKND